MKNIGFILRNCRCCEDNKFRVRHSKVFSPYDKSANFIFDKFVQKWQELCSTDESCSKPYKLNLVVMANFISFHSAAKLGKINHL